MSWAVPVWISDRLSTPSIPIHVADCPLTVEDPTLGTLHSAFTLVNFDPVAMYPDQFRDSAVDTAPTARGR